MMIFTSGIKILDINLSFKNKTNDRHYKIKDYFIVNKQCYLKHSHLLRLAVRFKVNDFEDYFLFSAKY